MLYPDHERIDLWPRSKVATRGSVPDWLNIRCDARTNKYTRAKDLLLPILVYEGEQVVTMV